LSVLCIAVGNPWRGDDGAAHRVLELIAPAPGLTRYGVLQLTPELAAEVARVEAVLFIDADVSAEEPSVERLAFGQVRGTPLAHSMTAAEVVYLAERLYGFAGIAFTCRVPAARFDGTELSPEAEAGAVAVAAMVRNFIAGTCANARSRPRTSLGYIQ
jgi:hydrogenase maturation protease